MTPQTCTNVKIGLSNFVEIGPLNDKNLNPQTYKVVQFLQLCKFKGSILTLLYAWGPNFCNWKFEIVIATIRKRKEKTPKGTIESIHNNKK